MKDDSLDALGMLFPGIVHKFPPLFSKPLSDEEILQMAWEDSSAPVESAISRIFGNMFKDKVYEIDTILFPASLTHIGELSTDLHALYPHITMMPIHLDTRYIDTFTDYRKLVKTYFDEKISKSKPIKHRKPKQERRKENRVKKARWNNKR